MLYKALLSNHSLICIYLNLLENSFFNVAINWFQNNCGFNWSQTDFGPGRQKNLLRDQGKMGFSRFCLTSMESWQTRTVYVEELAHAVLRGLSETSLWAGNRWESRFIWTKFVGRKSLKLFYKINQFPSKIFFWKEDIFLGLVAKQPFICNFLPGQKPMCEILTSSRTKDKKKESIGRNNEMSH